MTFADLTALFDISLDRANQFYSWGWRASIFGALVTFLGLGFLYWGTRARDREFDQKMANLNLEAAHARERAGRLEERAAGLERDAANARAETERLKKELGWRELSPQQQEVIRTVLAKNRMQVTIGWTSGDPESAMFARHLANAFLAAGSEISAFAPFGMLGEQVFGLHVSGSEQNEIDALGSAGRSAGRWQFVQLATIPLAHIRDYSAVRLAVVL